MNAMFGVLASAGVSPEVAAAAVTEAQQAQQAQELQALGQLYEATVPEERRAEVEQVLTHPQFQPMIGAARNAGTAARGQRCSAMPSE